MARGRLLLFVPFLLAAVLSLVPLGGAEHTPHHRYYFTGIVTNENGEPVCGIVARAADITTPNGDGSDNRTATTDGSGRYTIQLHMHDGDQADGALPSDVGNTVRVSLDAYGTSRTVAATPNSGNADGWGSQTIHFTVPGTSKGPCLDLATILLWGGMGIAVVLGLVVVVLVARGRIGGGGPSHALRSVPGVTRVRARELGGFGIRTVKDLAGADPKDLSEGTNLTPKEARLLVKRANESLAVKK